MSSLVAYYGSSDEEEDAEEMDLDNKSGEESTVSGSGKTSFQDPPLQKQPDSSLGLATLLPKPKASSLNTDCAEIDPIPPKKTYGDEESLVPPGPSSRSSTFPGFSAKKSATGVMQISIPSLKDFADDEDANKNKKKQFNASQKGSGLFAILPEPKSQITFRLPEANSNLNAGEAERKPAEQIAAETELASSLAPNMMSLNLAKQKSVPLIPHVVHQSIIGKRPAASNDRLAQVRAKYMKQESNFKIVSRNSSASSSSGDKKIKQKNDEDDSDDEDGGNVDFFSLDSKSNDNFERLKNEDYDESGNFTSDSVIGKGYVDKYAMEQEQVEALPAPSFQEQEAEVTPNPGLAQPDLMQYIQPKRGRAKNEPINIIDVSADDLRPASTDWIKSVTDKSVMPPRKANLPGGMMKRKHQITYLAAEAKAREEELQNQWAQNRTARRATQSKYGF